VLLRFTQNLQERQEGYISQSHAHVKYPAGLRTNNGCAGKTSNNLLEQQIEHRKELHDFLGY
jgi:hypothetical protein